MLLPEPTAHYSEYFVSDKGTYKIQNSGDGSAQVVQLVKPHVHSYTYSGDGAVITESCTCGHSETAALSMADGVNLTYMGNAIEACRITYSDGWAGGTLNLSYSNNTNAGRATATILKNGETASLNFDIAEKSLTDSMITLASGPHNYTGSAVTPAVTVKDGSKTLVSGTDYTVSYANNTNVGTATVTVTGMGNYTGTINKDFTITGKSLTDDMITIAFGPHNYTGSAVTPAVTVTDGSKTLESGTDYTVGYGNNTNAGTATVTVTGKGNYTGIINKDFTITGRSLTDSMVTIASGPHNYTGSAVTPAVTVTDGSVTLESGTDYTVNYENNTNAGTATVTVMGKGNYTGAIEKTFDIILTDADQVAAAKEVVMETLGGYTATNSTTKQEIQEKIDTALSNAGISGVDVTVGDIVKTEATTEAAGSISGDISIVSKNDSSETDSVPIIKTIEKLPKTEAEKVADAKKVVEETLAGITATNSTTKQEIQDRIDTALTQAGITEVTVTVGDLEKTEATTEAAGSISGNISIVSDNDSVVTESVPIIKTIEKLPKTEAEKVAGAKKVVEDVLEEVLAGITTASEVTSEDIQREIDEALTNAGITDVTVTVGDLTKTEATTEEEGSISGSITLVSDNDSDVTDSVPIHKTIAPLHTHSYTWIITKEATADEEGEMTGTCICGEITTETIPKTGESGSGTVIVKEDEENELNGSLEDKEDVKGKVSLTDTEKEQLNTGEDLVIILRLRDVDVAVDTQEKTEIQDKLEANTLGTFFDIELLKQIGGTETKITETTDEIEITFEIPEHLRNTDDTVTRTYQIMRHHDGVVDILDVENYDEKAHLLTFKTDKFSTYALVYRDAAKNPTDTPGPTETPGTPSPTPVTTETPDTSTPTPVPTNTPGIPTPTPVTTETPGTPLPTPGTTATPEIVLSKDALSLNALLNVSQTGKKINIAWGKVEGADGYDVYVQYCGKEFTKKSITAIKSGKTTKVTVKKVNGKALNQKKIYKIYVLAYKLVDGKKVTLAKTITAHIAGKKNAKYTNVKLVKVKKSSYSLKQGKTAVIKASTVLESKGKKQLSNAHAKEFRYATDNKEVATVSKKGKIKAVGKGSCTIYIYARNGCVKKIKVKVK